MMLLKNTFGTSKYITRTKSAVVFVFFENIGTVNGTILADIIKYERIKYLTCKAYKYPDSCIILETSIFAQGFLVYFQNKCLLLKKVHTF